MAGEYVSIEDAIGHLPTASKSGPTTPSSAPTPAGSAPVKRPNYDYSSLVERSVAAADYSKKGSSSSPSDVFDQDKLKRAYQSWHLAPDRDSQYASMAHNLGTQVRPSQPNTTTTRNGVEVPQERDMTPEALRPGGDQNKKSDWIKLREPGLFSTEGFSNRWPAMRDEATAIGAGTAAGGLAEALPVPGSGILGGVAGYEAAKEGSLQLNKQNYGVVDTRSALAHALDTTEDTGFTTAGGVAGAGVGHLIKAAGGKALGRFLGASDVDKSTAIADAFDAEGIPKASSLGNIVESPTIVGHSKGLVKSPAFRKGVQTTQQGAREAFTGARDDMIANTGGSVQPDPNDLVQKVITGHATKTAEVAQQEAQNVYKYARPTDAIQPMETMKTLVEHKGTLLSPKDYPPELQDLADTLQNHGKNGKPVELDKFWNKRNSFGPDVSQKLYPNMDQKVAANVYRSMSQDIGDSLKAQDALHPGTNVGTNAADAFTHYNSVLSKRFEDMDTLKGVANTNDDNMYTNLLNARNKGSAKLDTFKRVAEEQDPQLWKDFRATVLHNMSQSPAGTQERIAGLADPQQFLKNKQSLSKPALDTLAPPGSPERAHADNLETVAGAIKGSKDMQNLSERPVKTSFKLPGRLDVPVDAVNKLIEFVPKAAVSKMLTNEKFADWAARGFKAGNFSVSGKSPAAWAGMLGTMAANEKDSDLKQHYYDLRDKLLGKAKPDAK